MPNSLYLLISSPILPLPPHTVTTHLSSISVDLTFFDGFLLDKEASRAAYLHGLLSAPWLSDLHVYLGRNNGHLASCLDKMCRPK